MTAASPIIDSLEFARAGEKLAGTVSVAQLTRLAESLFDSDGGLEYLLEGGYDGRHRPRLRLRVEGEIHLKCHRCLGRLPYQVAVESSLLVLMPGASAATENVEDLDGVPADEHTDTLALVEDEVLLAIPYVARHAEGECSAPRALRDVLPVSPFAALDKLRRS